MLKKIINKFLIILLKLSGWLNRKIYNFYAKSFIQQPRVGSDSLLDNSKPAYADDLVIGIVTFKDRFDSYFVKLITAIREQDALIPIMVEVNGAYSESFDSEYRKRMLEFVAQYENIYVRFYPNFNGLAKMWNDLITSSASKSILILNDDVSLLPNALTAIKNCKKNSLKSFKINGSWSHFVINRQDFWNIGPFDQRLLGIGEEDGDFEWRYSHGYGKDFPNVVIDQIKNHVDYSHEKFKDMNTEFGVLGSAGKYSSFNHKVMYTVMYNVDYVDGIRRGICTLPLIPNDKSDQLNKLDEFWISNRSKV